ncbi:hypothetical protein AAFF_G00379700 [Aldrovandia affinis]|uniref:Uncharacterized protein n=1 Tax=Aldrovandia affinis TaxID=143900 RepID=A0AAD7R4K1_9TELE|nr:hypothetical protein AAFF_G00379700 [Aldrovandia affinis]
MMVILCVSRTGVSSAQYVVLNGVVGQSVAFPDAVKISGTLIHEHEPIGDVTGGQFRGFREGRVQWNSATGLFSISGLKVEDSGMYALLNNDGRSKEYQYQLNVGVPHLGHPSQNSLETQLLAIFRKRININDWRQACVSMHSISQNAMPGS